MSDHQTTLDFGTPTPEQRTFRAELDAHGKAVCPTCCKQSEKRKGALTPTQMRVLRRLYDHDTAHRGAFVDLRNKALGAASRDHTQLKHWALIERRAGRVGWWRITETGREFVDGIRRLPRYVWTLNDRVLCFAGPRVSFADVVCGPDETPRRTTVSDIPRAVTRDTVEMGHA